MISSSQVVATARELLGVKYQHQGRTKLGVDCIGMVVYVAHKLGLSSYDVTDYPRMPDCVALLRSCKENMIEKRRDDYSIADVIVLSFNAECPAHFAIVTDYPFSGFGIIHAYARSRRVVEHRLDDVWVSRIHSVYKLPGVI